MDNEPDITSLPSTPSRTSFEDHAPADLPLLAYGDNEADGGLQPGISLSEGDDGYLLTHGNGEAHKVNRAAKNRANLEHRLSVHDAVKDYPMAIFWCLVVSTTVIMEGFDTIMIGNFYAFPTFQRKCRLPAPSRSKIKF